MTKLRITRAARIPEFRLLNRQDTLFFTVLTHGAHITPGGVLCIELYQWRLHLVVNDIEHTRTKADLDEWLVVLQ